MFAKQVADRPQRGNKPQISRIDTNPETMFHSWPFARFVADRRPNKSPPVG
ncbi:hypothetical protein RMSM_04853 [Rhodopirellula maiorica SM1]|uniref:Uncharacterized protein n=1 Tax=Rhodopirellula maiorica SM1 TaxID=1265738 RepID=M5RFH3_9BACT|nr:hypothetical protein RMSM_04853 [Rhodopirellula maiorica SM1]